MLRAGVCAEGSGSATRLAGSPLFCQRTAGGWEESMPFLMHGPCRLARAGKSRRIRVGCTTNQGPLAAAARRERDENRHDA